MKGAPQFQRPEGRADFELARNAARAMLSDESPEEALRALQRLDHELDEGVSRVKAGLLGAVLCWKPDDRALSAWIYDQHCEFAELARRGADIFERRLGGDNAATARLVAMAFMHWGEAAKWVVGRRRRYDYSWLHWLMRMAMSCHRHVEPVEVRLDARTRAITIEALYFRTLVLDRFGGGDLTRQQIEVLDAWLWEWADALRGQSMHPGGPTLRADLDGKGGLRHGRRSDGGACLYLPIAPLEARREATIRQFHRGRIVPAIGIASDFRVEEHVAVLERLHALFQAKEEDDEPRAKRRPAASTYVEVHVGLTEILSRGLVPDAGRPQLTLVARNGVVNMEHRMRAIQFGDENESPRRLLRLVDASDAGFGFEAQENEASGMGVGDLVGMRFPDGEPCVLGRIVRRVPGQHEGEVVLGVQAISRSPQAITLARTQRQDRPDDEERYIYVAGADDSGAQDAFVVPDKLANDGDTREARIGDDLFTLRLNRVRGRGRGWVLAGFEIVGAKRIAPACPKLELDEDDADDADDADDDPYKAELTARLL